MSNAEGPEINMSRIKVSGVGGLGMVAIAGVMAYALPEARGFVFASLAGGFIVGVAFVAYRRWVRPEPPHGPTLMVDATAVADTTPERPGNDHAVKLHAVPRDAATVLF
jgi:hypothetical protein